MPNPLQAPSDEELARTHLAGDDGAFRLLVERYARPLYRFAYRLTGSTAEAEDIAQTTFLRVYEHLPRARLDAPLKPWIYQICANLCRNHFKRKKSLLFSQLEREGDDGEPISFIDSVASDDPPALESIERDQQIALVRAAIAKLPAKYRIVLSLYYFEGFSYEDIAGALALPLNTVRTHLKRAKDRLLPLLAPPAAPEQP